MNQTPFEAQRQAIARAALADAPTGDPCPACYEIHESATAEADCITAEEETPRLRTGTVQNLVAGATNFNELVAAYHRGEIDAEDIPGYRR